MKRAVARLRNWMHVLPVLAILPSTAVARTLVADPGATSGEPDYYRTLVDQLAPGDTLFLPAGTYRDRLSLTGVQGQPGAWITIQGPSSGSPATITTTSTCCNNVQLDNTAYVVLRNLVIDSAGIDAIDGINAKGNPTHDILIEGCTLVGQDSHQQTVGISTKSPAWNWTIRRNRIVRAGTGMYLGSSDGTQPFIGGTVEGNLILDTIGYNIQIKHQTAYDGQSWVSQLPPGPHRTILRDNVFIKTKGDWNPALVDGPRPNLLTGTFPDIGLGSTDMYEIYGNFFYRNVDESLLQSTGRVSVHDNIFVGPPAGYYAAYLTDHNGPLKEAYVYNNTVYAAGGYGIRFGTQARTNDAVVGNLVFADANAVGGSIRNVLNNVTASIAAAPQFVNAPSLTLGSMDFYPRSDCSTCSGSPLDLSAFTAHTAYDRDFNGQSKGAFTYRGAYAGAGANPGWRLAADFKGTAASGDSIPPAAPDDLLAR